MENFSLDIATFRVTLPPEGFLPGHILEAVSLLQPAPVANPHGPKDNSVPLSENDVARAKMDFVFPLPAADVESHPREQRYAVNLYNALRGYLQQDEFTGSPVIVDIGCALGEVLAKYHVNSSVWCLYEVDRATKVPHSAASLGNFLWSGVKQWYREPSSELLRSCNLITTSLLLSPTDNERGRTINDILSLAAMSRRLFVTATYEEWALLQDTAGSHRLFTTTKGDKASMELRLLGTISSSLHGSRFLVGTKLLTSQRACAKTWKAPLVQWDRRTIVVYDHDIVKFRVESTKGAHDIERTIHPLEYLPSLNLDTILGAGVGEEMRARLFGQMIATPRYSDPLPHNWVVVGQGRVVRIDKEDRRYDRNVNENLGYWGHSTRGYVHLFGHHLCLPLTPTGVPKMTFGDSCAGRCRSCLADCSYLPKGTMPCAACLQCGLTCIEGALKMTQGSRTAAVEPMCQKTYSSMHSAVAVWKKWEAADTAAVQNHQADW